MSRKVLYTLTVWVTEDQDPDDPLPDATDDRNMERAVRRALNAPNAPTRLDADCEVLSRELIDVVTHYTGSAHTRAQHDRVTTIADKVDCPKCLEALHVINRETRS